MNGCLDDDRLVVLYLVTWAAPASDECCTAPGVTATIGTQIAGPTSMGIGEHNGQRRSWRNLCRYPLELKKGRALNVYGFPRSSIEQLSTVARS